MNPSIETLWKDNDLLAVNKPLGLLVDSGGRGDDLVTRTGCFAFHRLDKETSGIVLLGRSKRYAKEITALFEEKRIRKAYLAVVKGDWTQNKVELPIEDRQATTTFRKLAMGSFDGAAASLIEALPKTGRRHQIRIHAAHAGHPVLGDKLYAADGASVGLGHALHAYQLDFRHPAGGETISVKCEPREWSATWLKDFTNWKWSEG